MRGKKNDILTSRRPARTALPAFIPSPTQLDIQDKIARFVIAKIAQSIAKSSIPALHLMVAISRQEEITAEEIEQVWLEMFLEDSAWNSLLTSYGFIAKTLRESANMKFGNRKAVIKYLNEYLYPHHEYFLEQIKQADKSNLRTAGIDPFVDRFEKKLKHIRS